MTAHEIETASPRRSRARSRLLALVAIALAVVLAALHLHQSPYGASDLRITPDEVEYAVGARRLATLGRYDLDVDGAGGASVPPRYTPWFSALLAPAYVAAPEEIGNGIWIVFAIALFGVIAARNIGSIVAGPISGACAAIALLALPPYPRVSREIMTDGPGAALALVALWCFVRWSELKPRVRESAVAGLLVACAFALRSPYLVLIVPFAWRALRAGSRRIAHCAALIAPVAIVVVLDAMYNRATFGDWRRTGYHYWCAIPYDYPELLLSASNVAANVRELALSVSATTLAAGAAGALAIAVRRPPHWRALLGFAAITAGPIAAFHLFYFFTDLRFHAYLFALCAVLAGIGAASVPPLRWREHERAPLAAIVVLLAAIVALQPLDVRPPSRRRTADIVHSLTPDDAVIISGLEPLYLAALAPPASHRIYVAASRDVEFASKVLMKQRAEPPIESPHDAVLHPADELLARGGHRAIARTADEMHDEIERWVRDGRPVFLETRFLVNLDALHRTLGSTLRPEDPLARVTRVVLK